MAEEREDLLDRLMFEHISPTQAAVEFFYGLLMAMTLSNTLRLALFGSYGDALAHVAQFPVQMITPFMEMRDGQPWLLIPADAGYPVDGEALESAARG